MKFDGVWYWRSNTKYNIICFSQQLPFPYIIGSYIYIYIYNPEASWKLRLFCGASWLHILLWYHVMSSTFSSWTGVTPYTFPLFITCIFTFYLIFCQKWSYQALVFRSQMTKLILDLSGVSGSMVDKNRFLTRNLWWFTTAAASGFFSHLQAWSAEILFGQIFLECQTPKKQ